jgi:hypothetical protein
MTRKSFNIIHSYKNGIEVNPERRSPDVVNQLFASVLGTMKATQAEKIFSNVETVALHLAVFMDVRGIVIIWKLTDI